METGASSPVQVVIWVKLFRQEATTREGENARASMGNFGRM